jgi:twinkle protein
MTDASQSKSRQNRSSGRAGTAERPAAARSNGSQGSHAPFSPSDLLNETGSAALEFRGLDPELAVKLGVTSAVVPDGGGDWVAIPFIKGGLTVNHKYRRVRKATDGRPNFAQDKGGLACWWNYDVITDPTLSDYKLIVTEGEIDAIVALQCGYPRVISVPNGAHDKELGDRDSAKLAFVADSLTDLSEVKTIVLAVDSDPAGSTLMTDLARRLGKARCQYVVYPEGCKDLNDVLLRHGQRGVVEVVEAAKWVQVKGLFRMSELPPVPVSQPFPIGMGKLDNHMLLRRGDFTVITGIPSHGKTALVTDIACRMAVTHDWTVCFASFEQDPQDDHRRALRTWYHRLPAAQQTPEQHVAADLWIDQSFGFIVPDEDSDATVNWLLERATCRSRPCMTFPIQLHGPTSQISA